MGSFLIICTIFPVFFVLVYFPYVCHFVPIQFTAADFLLSEISVSLSWYLSFFVTVGMTS